MYEKTPLDLTAEEIVLTFNCRPGFLQGQWFPLRRSGVLVSLPNV